MLVNNLNSLNIEIEDDYLIVERQIDTNQKSKILFLSISWLVGVNNKFIVVCP